MTDDIGEWSLDPAATRIAFKARGMWGLTPVTGQFTRAAGTLIWGPSGRASVHLRIDAASVDTGLAMRDRHLRSAEFLDTERYPTIKFGGDAWRTPDGLRVEGHLTVKSQTSALTVAVRTEPASDVVAGATETRVNLATFGIRPRLGMVRPGVEMVLTGRLIAAVDSHGT